jgi:ribosome biogenesis SPOUT family RNA methylase Rps3
LKGRRRLKFEKPPRNGKAISPVRITMVTVETTKPFNNRRYKDTAFFHQSQAVSVKLRYAPYKMRNRPLRTGRLITTYNEELRA